MEKEKELLEILRHTRHDWLNVMQLIKGNLTLKKYERIHEIIESVTSDAMNESRLTNLEIPTVAAELLTYNWGSKPLRLEVNVVGETNGLAEYEAQISSVSKRLIEMFERFGVAERDHHLLIVFLFTDEHFQLIFDYHGPLRNQKKDWQELVNDFDANVQLVEWHHDECVLSVSFY